MRRLSSRQDRLLSRFAFLERLLHFEFISVKRSFEHALDRPDFGKSEKRSGDLLVNVFFPCKIFSYYTFLIFSKSYAE